MWEMLIYSMDAEVIIYQYNQETSEVRVNFQSRSTQFTRDQTAITVFNGCIHALIAALEIAVDYTYVSKKMRFKGEHRGVVQLITDIYEGVQFIDDIRYEQTKALVKRVIFLLVELEEKGAELITFDVRNRKKISNKVTNDT